MISDYRCFFCFVKAFESLIEQEKLSLKDKNIFVSQMSQMYLDTKDNFSAPIFSSSLHRLLKEYTGNNDPYKELKRKSNDLVLKGYNSFKSQILKAENSYDTALRLAVAGNIIDFAVSTEYDLEATIHKVLSVDFAIDDSLALKEALASAQTVLYLGDNSGEIVFDKLLVENLMHPNLKYAVRGAPVINDVTDQDAAYVEMDIVADVISNGYDAPSTIINKCSPEFLEIWEKADVVISKGQGNLEGLWEVSSKKIFFLLMVKCDVIADVLHVKKGDFVVKENRIK